MRRTESDSHSPGQQKSVLFNYTLLACCIGFSDWLLDPLHVVRHLTHHLIYQGSSRNRRQPERQPDGARRLHGAPRSLCSARGAARCSARKFAALQSIGSGIPDLTWDQPWRAVGGWNATPVTGSRRLGCLVVHLAISRLADHHKRRAKAYRLPGVLAVL